MILNDFRLLEGRPEKPTVVLIHGFGMTGHFWESPESCLVLGGLAPLSVLLADQPPASRKKTVTTGRMAAELAGMAVRLAGEGFSVVSWSQSAPLGSVVSAAAELAEVIRRVREKLPGRAVWLIAHSRGGLIARSFLQAQQAADIVGCITLGSPHHGTELASFSRFLRPVGLFLRKVFETPGLQGKIAGALQRVGMFLSSEAIIELKPGSGLLGSLAKPLPTQLALFSCGGTNPGLFTLYFKVNASWRCLVFPDFFLRLLPDRKIPPELLAGAGDGLVSASSAKLEKAEHRDFAVNHVQLAFDPAVYCWIRDILSGKNR